MYLKLLSVSDVQGSLRTPACSKCVLATTQLIVVIFCFKFLIEVIKIHKELQT